MVDFQNNYYKNLGLRIFRCRTPVTNSGQIEFASLSPARFPGLNFQFTWVLFTLLLAALSAPFWGLLFAKIAKEVKESAIGQVMPFDSSEELLLSRPAWKRLRVSMYLQGLLYFTVYFVFVALPMVFVVNAGPLFVSGYLLEHTTDGAVPEGFEPPISILLSGKLLV